jgi:hypothetical protein
MQAALEPCVDEGAFAVDYGIRRPLALPPRLSDPLFRLGLNLVQAHIHVCRYPGRDFVRPVEETAGVDELHGVERPSTSITLIAARILEGVQSQCRKQYMESLTSELQCGQMPSTKRSARNLFTVDTTMSLDCADAYFWSSSQ